MESGIDIRTYLRLPHAERIVVNKTLNEAQRLKGKYKRAELEALSTLIANKLAKIFS